MKEPEACETLRIHFIQDCLRCGLASITLEHLWCLSWSRGGKDGLDVISYELWECKDREVLRIYALHIFIGWVMQFWLSKPIPSRWSLKGKTILSCGLGAAWICLSKPSLAVNCDILHYINIAIHLVYLLLNGKPMQNKDTFLFVYICVE